MKNEVITVSTRFGLLTYLSIKNTSNLYNAHHKLNIKQAILGGLFTYYNDEMDFKNSNIIVDKR